MTGTEGMTQQRSRPAVVTIAVAATLLTALGLLGSATPTLYTGGAVVAMVSMLAAMALFGLPRANDFFRPEPPTVATPPPLNG